jgi:hypothetical protein
MLLSVPTPQQGQDFGDAIKRAAEQVAATAISGAQREIEARLDGLRAQRAGMEEALRTTDSRPARLSIERRITGIDREITELEQALQKLDVNVARDVQRNVVAETRQPTVFAGRPPRDPFDPTPLVMGVMGILFVAFPLTLAIVRFLWKRATNAPSPPMTVEQSRRFDRLEQSVDAIAIEVERISENQRYLTRLLGEPKKEGVGIRG